MPAFEAAVPLVSVLIGSAITYGLSVRSRRRSRAEDVFHDAIAAVSVAVAAADFITAVGSWKGATPEEHARFVAQLGMEGSANYVRAVAAARAAVARASAYEPALRAFSGTNPAEFGKHADAMIEMLRARIDS